MKTNSIRRIKAMQYALEIVKKSYCENRDIHIYVYPGMGESYVCLTWEYDYDRPYVIFDDKHILGRDGQRITEDELIQTMREYHEI